MKKVLFLLGLLLLTALVFSGVSYSWYVHKSDTLQAEAVAAKIRTELNFSLNNCKGIPGETIAISAGNGNIIRKGKHSEDYIFKLTYTASFKDNEMGEPYIMGLGLAKPNELGLIEAEAYNAKTRTVSYYGKHTGNNDIKLGELLATFNEKLKSSDMDKRFDIEAAVEACQITEAAASGIFGIDASSEKYASLFQ